MTTGQAFVFAVVLILSAAGFVAGGWLFYAVWLPWRERRHL